MKNITITERFEQGYRGTIMLETDDIELLATVRSLLTAPAVAKLVELVMPRRTETHEAAMMDVKAANAYADYAGQQLADARAAVEKTDALPEDGKPIQTITLSDARVRAGFRSQRMAAEHLGVSACYVSQLESHPVDLIPERMLEKMCKAYDVEREELRDPRALRPRDRGHQRNGGGQISRR